MGYRILVDENLDPKTAELLRDRGDDAVHVQESLGKGTTDPPIVDYTIEHHYLLLTNDTDFLRQDRRRELSVLYCPDSAMHAHELVMLITELEALVPDQTDLPEVTWFTEETFSWRCHVTVRPTDEDFFDRPVHRPPWSTRRSATRG